jgi:parallel beta-helix repeat protein
MAIVFDGTNKRFAERLDDLEGEVFGPGSSAYQIGNRLNGAAGTTVSAALVTATGSTASRSLAERAADVVNVKDFGARGDGATDDTAAIISAVAATPAGGGDLLFPPGGEYLLTDEVTITQSRTRIRGYGAKLTQTGTRKCGLVVSGANDVTIEGLHLYQPGGLDEWYDYATAVPGATLVSIGVKFINSARGTVRNCKLEGWARAGVSVWDNSPDALVQGNTIIGVGPDPDGAGPLKGLVNPDVDFGRSNSNFGVEGHWSGLTSPGLRIIGNKIADVAQGVFHGEDWSGTVVRDNRFDLGLVGQACVYLDAASNVQIVGNECLNAGASAIKVQMVDTATVDPANVLIAGNIVSAARQVGILITPAVGFGRRFANVRVSDNIVSASGYDGIRVDQCDSVSIVGNTVHTCGEYGIRLGSAAGSTTRNSLVAGNTIASTQKEALLVQLESSSYLGIVERNTITEPALAGGASAAVYLSAGEWIFRGNVIRSSGTPYAYNVRSHVTSIVTTYDNDLPAAKTNLLAGTVTAYSLTLDALATTGAGGVAVGGAGGVTVESGNIRGPRVIATGANGVLSTRYDGPYIGPAAVIYRNTSSAYGHEWRSNASVTATLDSWGVFNAAGGFRVRGGPYIYAGVGTPEDAVSAPVGSLFLRSDGGAATTLYVKESGDGDTGWVAK